MESIEQINILDMDWDVLFLLDACRYDYFESIYTSLYKGNLRKIRSFGNSTQTWHQSNFKGRDCSNIVYVTPIVNFDRWMKDYNFHKIIRSWKTSWDEKYGTVLPESTTKIALDTIGKYPDKRIIIHYMQPHIPYIGVAPKRKPRMPNEIDKGTKKPFGKTLRHNISKKLGQMYFRNDIQWKIMKHIGECSYVGDIYNEGGWDLIRHFYKETLLFTLIEIKEIISRYDSKKFVITADHGERLGEKGLFGHSQKRMDAVIRELPWFEVSEINETTSRKL